MPNNLFANAPTVGSHDLDPAFEDLQERVKQIEKRLNDAEEQLRANTEKRPSKLKWKKVNKFFTNGE